MGGPRPEQSGTGTMITDARKLLFGSWAVFSNTACKLYFGLFVVVLGMLSIFVSAYKRDHAGIVASFATYGAAIGATAFGEVIMAREPKLASQLRLLCLVLFIGAIATSGLLLASIGPIALWCLILTVIAWELWVIANRDNIVLRDQTDPEDILGGATRRPLSGNKIGFTL